MLGYFASQFGSSGAEGRKGRIFARIAGSEGQTRKRLAEEMAIRPATVSKLVLELIHDGLVVEARPETAGQKGRPEIALAPVPRGLVAIVCHLVSRTLQVTLVDMAGETLARERRALDAGGLDPAGFAAALTGMVARVRTEVPPEGRLAGVVLSLPGIIDEEQRIWRYAAHWPGLRDFDIGRLDDALGVQVIAAKNLKCELRARMDAGDAAGHEGVLLLHWGYGIGAAYARRGTSDLHYGSFGEVGHFCVDPGSTAQCKCGMTGCIEAEAGLWALLERRRDLDLPSDEWSFAEALRADPQMEDWSRPVTSMALCLRNLVLTLKPDHCVITGPFTQSPSILEALTLRFREVLPPDALVACGTVGLSAEAPGDRFEITGAAALAFARGLGELCAPPRPAGEISDPDEMPVRSSA